MDYTELLSNPVRMRVMQYLVIHEEATTGEIAGFLSDVPRRTLYRQIGSLIDAGAVIVKEERKVRGGTERLLTGNYIPYLQKIDFADRAYQYFMDLYLKFDNYSKEHGKKTDKAAKKDKLVFGSSVFYLDDEEMQAMLDEIYEMGIRYEKKHKEKYGDKTGGKLRHLSFISAPVE